MKFIFITVTAIRILAMTVNTGVSQTLNSHTLSTKQYFLMQLVALVMALHR